LVLVILPVALCWAVETTAQADRTIDRLVKFDYKPAPDFNLRDLEGNEVSLANHRKKVAVLDFWATWCAPCIKSFPAMQMAVDKYKRDPDVTFLFITTWEQKPNAQQSVQQSM
jgi:cytochrome c biogenesis protein CcmG/thiol:disulfide interchange protein DsbE